MAGRSEPVQAPEYGLIESDPTTFRQAWQAYVDQVTALQSRAGDLERVNTELHAALDETQATMAGAESARAQAEARAETLERQHAIAVAAYKQAMLNGDPSIPPTLVEGETIEAVDVSLEKARQVVAYV